MRYVAATALCRRAVALRGVPLTQEKSGSEVFAPEPLKTAPQLLLPWRWRSSFGPFLSALWLRRAVLCSSRRSTRWRTPRLTMSALPSFSRTARFIRRTACTRRRTTGLTNSLWCPMLRTRLLICTRARCRGRSTEPLRFRSPVPRFRRHILGTAHRTGPWTFAWLARKWPATFRRRWTETRRLRRAGSAWAFAAFKWCR
jgi:hypothetical protein